MDALRDELAEIDDAGAFISAASAGLQAALAVDVTAYCEWRLRGCDPGRVVLAPEVASVSEDRSLIWSHHRHEDLWIQHVTSSKDYRAVRLTDLASSTTLSRSPTYQGCYRPSGFRYMAHLALSVTADSGVAVGIGRTARDLDDAVMQQFQRVGRTLGAVRRRLVSAGRDPGHAPVGEAAGRAGDTWVVRGRSEALQVDAARTGGLLTPRQYQVLELVALGWTNERIARELHVSVGTVKKHVADTCRRLRVESRAAAAAWLAANRL